MPWCASSISKIIFCNFPLLWSHSLLSAGAQANQDHTPTFCKFFDVCAQKWMSVCGCCMNVQRSLLALLYNVYCWFQRWRSQSNFATCCLCSKWVSECVWVLHECPNQFASHLNGCASLSTLVLLLKYVVPTLWAHKYMPCSFLKTCHLFLVWKSKSNLQRILINALHHHSQSDVGLFLLPLSSIAWKYGFWYFLKACPAITLLYQCPNKIALIHKIAFSSLD